VLEHQVQWGRRSDNRVDGKSCPNPARSLIRTVKKARGNRFLSNDCDTLPLQQLKAAVQDTIMNQERSGPIGYTPCEECRGTGKKADETSCTNCWGTGLVAVFQQPTTASTPPVQERRRFPRYNTDLPVRLRDQQEQEFAGRCVVLGEGGLAAILSELLPLSSVVTLRLSIPAHPTALQPYAVVRNQLGLRHGFEFLSLTNSERVAVRQFCNGLRTQSDE